MPPATEQQLAAQRAQFETPSVGSIIELQPFRTSQEIVTDDGTTIRLTSLNPAANSWYVLEILPARGRAQAYHLENADPDTWTLSLSDATTAAMVVEGAGGQTLCRPWLGSRSELLGARESALPYAPVCGQRVYLRNRVSGSRTNREAVADFLRDNVVFGDSLVNLIRGTFYEDAFMQTAETASDGEAGAVVALLGTADLDRRPVMRTSIGFTLDGTESGQMEAGAWYAVADAPGIYASAMQPGMISRAILNRRGEANGLDGVENSADVYLVAFDLSEFDIGFEVGTDHPSLEWSPRPQRRTAEERRIPGPDGFSRFDPLVMVGMLSPSLTDRVAATFTAGFKRQHGAFRAGPLTSVNRGSHYGFLSNGVLLSRLHPGLSTLYTLDDGTIGMRTWTDEDAELLPRLRFARQNGVPLIAPHPETGEPVPGPLVTQWGPGNWSGSAEANLRTLRGGACLRTVGGRQFLIYAYFSAATPSGMARTFQAYGCDYAMLLDMNSQEHTYMALYTPNDSGDGLDTQHLVRAMSGIDASGANGTRIPRFVGFSDNRDFFYLIRRD